ncbi:MAG TPA: GxxExxY protein [Candidatus Limnocylindria bacterium]|nr:GxxExxY protein [Candidatus Limnocylindria bacterium]
MEVHRQLGPGFLEGVYQDALEIEFAANCNQFAREFSVPVTYKGSRLKTPYRSFFLCYGTIILELIAIKALFVIEDAPVLHYLKATGMHRAILLNFESPRVKYKRLVNQLHTRPQLSPRPDNKRCLLF